MSQRWSFEEDYIVCKFYLEHVESWKENLDCLMTMLREQDFKDRDKCSVRMRIQNYESLHTGKGLANIINLWNQENILMCSSACAIDSSILSVNPKTALVYSYAALSPSILSFLAILTRISIRSSRCSQKRFMINSGLSMSIK